MPTFGCFLSRLLVWLTRTLQTEIKISARHGAAAAASRLQPELGILSSIFHVFLPLIDFFVPVCLPRSLFIQTAHSGGNWKVPFSPVWLTRTARRIPAVSAASLLFCARVCITSALTRKMYFHLRCPKTGIGVSGCKEACVTYLDAVIIIGIFRGPVLCTANSPGMRKVRPSLAFAPLFAGRVLKGALLEKQPLATSLRAHAPLPG